MRILIMKKVGQMLSFWIYLLFPIDVDVVSGEDEGEYPDDRMMDMAKAGQNLGTNVTCMRWTSRLVTVGNDVIWS